MLASGASLAGDGQALAQTGAAFVKDVSSLSGGFEMVNANNDEYSVNVIFSPKEKLYDFAVLQLSLLSVSDDGVPSFDRKVVHQVSELTSAKPLVVRLTFMGSIPNYGVSYRDSDGKTHFCTLSESGFDGSLEVSEIR